MTAWPERGDLWQIWTGTQCHALPTLPNKQCLKLGDRAEAFLFPKMGLKEEGRLRGRYSHIQERIKSSVSK